MFFYPKAISQEAIDALAAVGLEFHGGELSIPDHEVQQAGNVLSLREVCLVRIIHTFGGSICPPKVWSTLEDAMVPTGQGMWQCPTCGFWMGDKFADEAEHDRQCQPQHKWVLCNPVIV